MKLALVQPLSLTNEWLGMHKALDLFDQLSDRHPLRELRLIAHHDFERVMDSFKHRV